MRILSPKSIIANKTIDWWMIGILGVAAFLRIFRLEALTEFLGDQGRTMIILDEVIKHGIIPLSGPTTLTGHHLGPIFYYLLLPGYILTRSPLGVSYWVVLLGILSVIVLYDLARRMFGVWPARAVSLLWAVSPYIIRADRVVWEPNLVPLFSLFFAYVLYRTHQEQKDWMWIALGVTVGVLVQLHYPNVFFIGLTGLYLIISRRRFVRAGLLWFAGFLLVLLPFLYYEYTVGFWDLQGISSIIAGGVRDVVGKRVMLERFLESAFRVFGRALPFMSRQSAAVVILLWTMFVYTFPTKRNGLLTVWVFGGLLGMARYSGVLYDHYLYFLVPVPFLMLASVIATLKQSAWRYVITTSMSLVIIIQFTHVDILNSGNNDVQRVRNAVELIDAEVGNSRFSFTLINSRSFSDLHYRYYMRRTSLKSESITDAYQTLVLICDQSDCPDPASLVKDREVQVLCFEEQCSGLYPKIQLFNDWRYVKNRVVNVLDVPSGRIYIFQRQVLVQ